MFSRWFGSAAPAANGDVLRVFDGMAMNTGEESVTAQTPEALAEAVINRWAELYASRYAVAASEVGDSPQVDIVLRGVTSLEDYARANKVLEGLTPVVRVGAHRVRDEQLTCAWRFPVSWTSFESISPWIRALFRWSQTFPRNAQVPGRQQKGG